MYTRLPVQHRAPGEGVHHQLWWKPHQAHAVHHAHSHSSATAFGPAASAESNYVREREIIDLIVVSIDPSTTTAPWCVEADSEIKWPP